MKKPSGKLIFGFILVMLGFYLSGIDVLPDPAAFLLIIGGIRDLTMEYSIKETAEKTSLWASISFFSVPSFFQMEAELLTEG